MHTYRVSFINEIPRNEKLFRCCQRSIIICSARTPARAVEAAKKRFARREGIRGWKIHAALIEIESIEVEVQPPDPTPGEKRIRASNERGELTRRAHSGNSRPGRRPFYSNSERSIRRPEQ